eukprot:gnl/MRDRNA2_/MRDRNA2_29757_c0_seq1.p1 gnl/MRDRNA2_/MRDRNA2_29757_c0~~gnl/MRDRNA2_/MRDRNA2_29757_c0_seq1.p1  ORF type:complete len:122 (-),score=26.30 gnl/MRDRNA2_/MRDRNA2_29757_c0_seq1:63-428(-)
MAGSGAVFEMISNAIDKRGSDLVKQTKAVFQFDLKGHGSELIFREYSVDLKNGRGSCKIGRTDQADCIITMHEKDFVSMANGKFDQNKALMSGKMKIQGNAALAQKLVPMFEAVRSMQSRY